MSSVRDQSGSTLILALAFILALGLGITALLSFLYAGLNASSVVRSQGEDVYAVDAAVESAIAKLRMDKGRGVAGAACADFVETVNGRTVTVTCEPQGTSRQTTTVGGGPVSGVPEGAMIALGPEGIDVQNNSPKTLRIGGDIISAGPVIVDNGTVAVDGDVYAPSCGGSGKLVTADDETVDIVCSTKPAVDPNYPQPSATQPPAQTLAGGYCDDPDPVPAGTYTDAQAWKDLVANCNGVLRFEGVYYLDFADSVTCSGAANGPQWCIENNNVTMTAGTIAPGPPATCTGTGAAFVLGGETRITVRAGTLQMCGFTGPGGAKISVYAKSPPPVPPPAPGPVTITLRPTVAKSTGSPSYDDKDDARTIDGTSAIADHEQKGSAATQTATITLSSFEPLPAGATYVSAVLRVAHREEVSSTATAERVQLALNGGVPTTYASTDAVCKLCWSETADTDEFDVTLALPTAAAVQAASIVYSATATLPKDATLTSELDGVELEVTYIPSVVPPVPWGTLSCAAAPCTVLDTDGSNSRVSFFGTIYTPESRVFLKAVNLATAAASRGIVARAIAVHVPTLVDADTFHISVDSAGGGSTVTAKGVVRLTARISGDSRVRLVTNVEFPDSSEPTPVEIVDWTVK